MFFPFKSEVLWHHDQRTDAGLAFQDIVSLQRTLQTDRRRFNPTAMGQSVSVMVQVRLSQQSPSDIDALMSAVHRLPETTECLLMTGNLDYVLKIQTKDVEALRDFVLKELKAIPCVSETSTMLILDVAKSTG